ncbi:MAG: hypothetical protein C0442_01535 [Chlorobiaceae bacterium]|nr:hypothetical protein [Chlorobiaceae bacterium]
MIENFVILFLLNTICWLSKSKPTMTSLRKFVIGNSSILQSFNPSILQSFNPSILQSCNPAILQFYNQKN